DLLFRLPVIGWIRGAERSNVEGLLGLVEKKGRVLEIGCGTGAYLDLYGAGSCVYGLDISRKMLDRAREKDRRGCVFLCSSATDLPFNGSVFDLLSAIGLLEYFRDKKKVLDEIGRVLVPGGHALVSYTNKNPLNLLRLLWGVRFYPASDDEMREVFEGCGFEVVETGKSLLQTQALLRKQ
ncbi:MAG: class I SAM-dependent methyltransferase, partial [Methanobacteriota archaeon]